MHTNTTEAVASTQQLSLSLHYNWNNSPWHAHEQALYGERERGREGGLHEENKLTTN